MRIEINDENVGGLQINCTDDYQGRDGEKRSHGWKFSTQFYSRAHEIAMKALWLDYEGLSAEVNRPDGPRGETMNPDWDAITKLLKEGEIHPVCAKAAEIDCYICDGKGCADCRWTGRVDVWIKPCGAYYRNAPNGAGEGGQMSNTAATLRDRFARYTTDNLIQVSPEDFEQHIRSRIGVIDAQSEGYSEAELDRQRDLSVKFRWGHNHDFGTFKLEGGMGDRHIDVLANFIDLFPVSLQDFKDKEVFDIGCWTGGTTLMLAALGAKVIAIEEVCKYADMARFLVSCFKREARASVQAKSIYRCDGIYNYFDIVHCPGVIYHLSDPVLALRIMYNSLRVGGTILLESTGLATTEPYCRFDGNQIHGQGTRAELNRTSWCWFIPSPSALKRMMVEAGFEDIRTQWAGPVGRLYAYGRKLKQVGICKAGLSVPGIA